MRGAALVSAVGLAACGHFPWGAGVQVLPPLKTVPVDNGLILALSPGELAQASASLTQWLQGRWAEARPVLGGTLLLPAADADGDLLVAWDDAPAAMGVVALEPLDTAIGLALSASLDGAVLAVNREGFPSCTLMLGDAELLIRADAAIDSDKLGHLKAPVVPGAVEVTRAPQLTYSTCWTLDPEALEQVVGAWLEAVATAIIAETSAELAARLPQALRLDLALGLQLFAVPDGGAASSRANLWVRAPEVSSDAYVKNVNGALVVPYSVLWDATAHPCVPEIALPFSSTKPIPSLPLASGTVIVSTHVLRQAAAVLWKTGALCGDRATLGIEADLGGLWSGSALPVLAPLSPVRGSETPAARASVRLWPESAPDLVVKEASEGARIWLDTGPMALELYTEIDGAQLRLATFEARAQIEGGLWVDEQQGVHWAVDTVLVDAALAEPGLAGSPPPSVADALVAEVVAQTMGAGPLWVLPPLPGPGATSTVGLAGGYLVFSR